MLLYLLPTWAVTLAGLWVYMLWDKVEAVRFEKHQCNIQIIEELEVVSKKSKGQVNEALEAAARVVIPADLDSLCRNDQYCRDK